MYRNVDYAREWDRQSTASYPEGLRDSDFDTCPPIRRTKSANDVSRFHRYFNLLRSHLKNRLTWKGYARILHHELRDFKTPAVKTTRKNRSKIKSLALSNHSDYVTASESPSLVEEQEQSTSRLGHASSCTVSTVEEFPEDNSSPKSGNASLHIKKIRNETKTFARGIFKSLDVLYKMHSKKSDTPLKPNKRKKHLVRTVDGTCDTHISSICVSPQSVDLPTCGSSNSSVQSGAGDSSVLRKRFKRELATAVSANWKRTTVDG